MLTGLYWKCSLVCLLCNSVKSFPNIILCSSTTAAREPKTFKRQFCARCARCFQAVSLGSGSEVTFATFIYIEWLEKHNGKYRWSDTLTSEKYGRVRKSASQILCQGTTGMGLPHERAQARTWRDPAQPVPFPTGMSAGWAEWGCWWWGPATAPGTIRGWTRARLPLWEGGLQCGSGLSGNWLREGVPGHGSWCSRQVNYGLQVPQRPKMLHQIESMSCAPPSVIFILLIIAIHGTVAAVLSVCLLSMTEHYYMKTYLFLTSFLSAHLFLFWIIPAGILTQNLYLDTLSLQGVCETLTR